MKTKWFGFGGITEVFYSPALVLSLYSITPYFLRQIFVDKNDSKKWSSKYKSEYKLFYSIKKYYSVDFEDSDSETINHILTWGLHPPLSSYPISVSDKELLTPEGLKKARKEVSSIQFIMIRDFIKKLKEKGIYDNTRIIITSDNGDRYDNTKMLLDNYEGKFEAKPIYDAKLGISSFIMEKDFNSEPNIFNIDSRALATPDIHSIIVTSFTNKSGYYDYTKVMPPKRVFNIADIQWTLLNAFIFGVNAHGYAKDEQKRFFESIRTNDGKFRYLRVNNLDTNGQEYRYYPFDKINELPAYEIVE